MPDKFISFKYKTLLNIKLESKNRVSNKCSASLKHFGLVLFVSLKLRFDWIFMFKCLVGFRFVCLFVKFKI